MNRRLRRQTICSFVMLTFILLGNLCNKFIRTPMTKVLPCLILSWNTSHWSKPFPISNKGRKSFQRCSQFSSFSHIRAYINFGIVLLHWFEALVVVRQPLCSWDPETAPIAWSPHTTSSSIHVVSRTVPEHGYGFTSARLPGYAHRTMSTVWCEWNTITYAQTVNWPHLKVLLQVGEHTLKAWRGRLFWTSKPI